MATGFPLQSLSDAEITVSTAGTAEQVNSGTSLLCFHCIITADGGNSGNMFVGSSSVASTHYAKKLAADESITLGFWSPIPQFDLSSIWLDTSSSGDGVHILYM